MRVTGIRLNLGPALRQLQGLLDLGGVMTQQENEGQIKKTAQGPAGWNYRGSSIALR